MKLNYSVNDNDDYVRIYGYLPANQQATVDTWVRLGKIPIPATRNKGNSLNAVHYKKNDIMEWAKATNNQQEVDKIFIKGVNYFKAFKAFKKTGLYKEFESYMKKK